DLSALDPSDGVPDCVSAYAVGTKVYVACGLLDHFTAIHNGKVAVIDSTTDTVLTTMEMNAKNPYGFFVRTPETSAYAGDLLIATAPSFTSYETGCIERVSTGSAPTVSCALTNQEAGGFVNKLAVGDKLYLAVGTYDMSFQNPTGKLRAADMQTGGLAAEPLS